MFHSTQKVWFHQRNVLINKVLKLNKIKTSYNKNVSIKLKKIKGASADLPRLELVSMKVIQSSSRKVHLFWGSWRRLNEFNTT